MGDSPTDADGVELTPAQRADIDGMYLRLADSDLYELLGVPRKADRKTIRDAYFALSQRFHPDAFYGRDLGRWKARIEVIFRECTRAYDTLSNRNQRAEYDALLAAQTARGEAPPGAPQPPAQRPAVAAPNDAPQPDARAAVERPATPEAPRPPTSRAGNPATPPTASADASGMQRVIGASADVSGPHRTLVGPARPGTAPAPPAPPPPPPPQTEPARPPPVQIDSEVARRAAREALARRMGTGLRATGRHQVPDDVAGAGRTTGRFQAPDSAAGVAGTGVRVTGRHQVPSDVAEATNAGASAGASARTTGRHQVPDDAAIAGSMRPGVANSTPLQSLEVGRVARDQAERVARLARIVRDADDSLARGDLLGASNALAIAKAMAPENAALAAHADEVARRLAESLVVKYTEKARADEKSGHWLAAAESWQKAALGRPGDATPLVRAAQALLRAGKDLPRAAELARRATQLAPRSAEAQTVLAQVFVTGGLKASALSALESAQRLDPSSLVVKDLMRQLKG